MPALFSKIPETMLTQSERPSNKEVQTYSDLHNCALLDSGLGSQRRVSDPDGSCSPRCIVSLGKGMPD
jgi:hypothetical protein